MEILYIQYRILRVKENLKCSWSSKWYYNIGGDPQANPQSKSKKFF